MFPTHENTHSMVHQHYNIIYTSETTEFGMKVPKEVEKERKHFQQPFSNEFLSDIPRKRIYRDFPFLCKYINSLLLTTCLQRQEACDITNSWCTLNLIKYIMLHISKLEQTVLSVMLITQWHCLCPQRSGFNWFSDIMRSVLLQCFKSRAASQSPYPAYKCM
jgi:hypothetical protein